MILTFTKSLAVIALLGLTVSSAPVERTPKELLAIIRAEGDNITVAVLEELAKQETEGAFDALVEGTGELKTPAKLLLAYRAFRHFDGVDGVHEEAVEFLAECAADQRGQKGVHATLALGNLMPESGDALVAIALKPVGADHQAAALCALMPSMAQLDEKLLRKLTKSKVLEVRYEGMLEELRRIEDVGKRADRLSRLHRSKAEVERLVAVELLAMLDHSARFEMLEKSLGDAYRPVSRKAVASLVRSRELRAVELLVGRLSEASEAEVWRLTRALGELTGLSFGRRPATWMRWWKREGKEFDVPDVVVKAKAEEPLEQGASSSSFYGLPIHDEHIVFAVDTSDSMKAKVARTDGSRRIDVAKKELRRAIEGLNEQATFDLVNFGKSAWAWQGELVQVKKRARKGALKWVAGLKLSWGTEVHGALRQAFRDPAADAIVFLTDGDPQISVLMDRGTIRRLVGQWNRTRHTTIDCLTIGTERKWLKKLAEASGGRYRKID